jgi:transposase
MSGVSAVPCIQSDPNLAKRTGRHVQTVRKALKKLQEHGLTAKSGKLWRGRAIEDIDLDQLSRAVNTKGAAVYQKERHKADRLRHRLRTKLWQTKKVNAEITEE